MLTLYAETAVEVKPTSTTQRIDIVVPRANGSYDRSKYSKKQHRHNRLASDDTSYAAEYLASASSIFFRHAHSFPRSFLWRIVAHERVLELSNADFSRHEDKDREADTILAFEFQDRISPRGISICDSGKGSEFHVFVLTRENEVFELRIQTQYFQSPDSIPQDITTWCTPIRASSLSIDKAFHIQATNPQDVFVSFASGKVQHWKRGDAQSQWTHVNYDDKTWGSSLFSMVTRKGYPDIDLDGMRLAYNTAHAMARSGQYLFTVCLNHTLRVWHLESGKLVDSRDLLDRARDPQEHLQLKPAEPGYVQFLEGSNKHDQILLTHSPLNGGQVTLWRVKNVVEDETDLFSMEDMTPNSTLALPDPDPTGTSVWMLAGLKVIFDKQTKDWQAWVLWRNNNFHRAYTLVFGLADLSNQWQNDWVAVSPAPHKSTPPDFVLADAQDVKSKWLQFIFFPGRYSTALLETVLVQYSSVLDAKLPGAYKNRSLQERMEAIVMSQVSLRKYDDGTEDNDRYALDADRQWRRFWLAIANLNEARCAPLGLAADSVTGMVTLTMTDMCCPIRECTNLELLQANPDEDMAQVGETARTRWPYRKLGLNAQEANTARILLHAARDFYKSFSPELIVDFEQTLEEDLHSQSDPANTPQRIVDVFNQIDLANAVTDEAEKTLHKDLSKLGGTSSLSNKMFEIALLQIVDHKQRHGRAHQQKTPFGLHVTFAALLEEITNVRLVLLSVLALVIFVDETNHFNPALVFDELIKLLKVQERNLWLATHSRTSTSNDSSATPVIQDIYYKAIRPQLTDHFPLPHLLTRHIQEYFELISGESAFRTEENAVYLQCWLLKHNELQLANDFLKFQPTTAWSLYIKGRLYLTVGEYQKALKYFTSASPDMSGGKALGKLEEFSAGLLTSEEAAHFYSGMPLYLQHIITLFEGHEAYSQAADVARSTLESLQPVKSEPQPNFKQNILLRLFTAELKTSRFDSAFDALVQFSDPVLQRASTTELIDTMLSSSTSLSDTAETVKHIQKFPLSFHPQIATTIDQHLASLAKKQSATPSSGWLSNSTTDYLSILHALRLSRNDYRGAMSTLFDRLRIIQKSGRARSDPQATSLRHALLALINAMTCVSEDEAFIVADAAEDPRIGGKSLKRLRPADDTIDENSAKKRTRIVVTLDDLRREYQNVLDRCSRIERGDFEFSANDVESEDEDDGVWEGSRLQIDQNWASGALVLSHGDAMQLA